LGKHLLPPHYAARTNIEAAKAARGVAKRMTAITSDAQSILAKTCDDLIKLDFRKTGELTPGTVSFTTTLLACCSRVRELTAIPDLRRVLDSCVRWSDTVQLPAQGTAFIVGRGLSCQRRRTISDCGDNSGYERNMVRHTGRQSQRCHLTFVTYTRNLKGAVRLEPIKVHARKRET